MQHAGMWALVVPEWWAAPESPGSPEFRQDEEGLPSRTTQVDQVSVIESKVPMARIWSPPPEELALGCFQGQATPLKLVIIARDILRFLQIKTEKKLPKFHFN